MTVDRDALTSTRAARARVEELEKALDLARANYHTSVRRLYESGASLRELATGLGVSHQRIHQIIEAAAAAQERARSISTITACDFCGQPRRDGAPFVAGPGVGICGECVDAAGPALEGTYRSPSGILFTRADPNAIGHCAFCKKRARQVNRLVTSDDVSVCDECLVKCQGILERKTGTAASGSQAAAPS
jgi:hypothetical protein